MLAALAQPAASIDDALYKYCGSSAGWESAAEYVYGSAAPSTKAHGVSLQNVQPLPPAFTSQYNEVRYKSFMGLFPEINRAWLTVDSKLCLWGYSPPTVPSTSASNNNIATISRANDFYVYEGFQQIIVSVALVRARPGVFVDHVKYLVAVATPVDVTLLGVTFSPNGELSLVPTQISVATDNVLMLKIVSTSTGRIFMAGADGSLHEFAYESRPTSGLMDLLSGRPAKRARKLVHNATPLVHYVVPAAIKSFFSRGDELVDLAVDSHRSSLYTLSQNGSLTLYDITEESSTRLIRSVDISHESRNLVSFSFPSGSREYVSIHAVPPRTSKTVHLIVVTSFGERIYFTTLLKSASSLTATGLGALPVSKSGEQKNTHSYKTKSLRCVGYRPSPDRSNTRTSRPCVHIAWCAQGAAIFADLRENDPDRLITLYPDASMRDGMSTHGQTGTQVGPHPVEIVFETSLGTQDDGSDYQRQRRGVSGQGTPTGNGGGFVSNSSSFEGNRTFAIASIAEENPVPESELSEWPLDPPAQFWVLTSSAVNLYELVRPVDHLRDILAAGGSSGPSVQQFFAQHGIAESCAMCLEIAVSHPALLNVASRVFYTRGSDQRFDSRQANMDSQMHSDGGGALVGGTKRRSQSFRRSFRDDVAGNRNSMSNHSFDVGRPTLPSAPMAQFSGAHDGASLYLAKVVHPLWNRFITSNRDPRQYQCLAVSKEYISQIRDKVFAFVSFLETYTPDEMLPARAADNQVVNGLHRDHETNRVGSMRNRHGSIRLPALQNGGHHDEQRPMHDDVHRGSFDVKPLSEARRAEAASIIALKDLGIRIVEGLALLMILSDHQLHRLVPSIPQDIQELFVKMRLCDLVAAEVGSVVSASLIEAIFGSYSDSTSAVGNVGRILQERCPSYFGDSDVTLHRGLALLREAMSSITKYGNTGVAEYSVTGRDYNVRHGLIEQDPAVASAWASAQNLAEEAATVLKTVPERIFDIPTICNDFRMLRAIPALVDVALTIGRVSEAAGNQSRAKVAYDCIFDALRPLIHESGDFGSEASMAEHGQHDKPEQLAHASLRVAFSAKSEVFLKALYEFLLESKHGEEHLLQHASPSVEVYLEQVKALDLLWRYCARHLRHLEAAMILLNLAEREECTPLVDRLNYLSCALHNAKTAVSKGDARAESMLTEISDFMDVAKVQLRVRDELQHVENAGATEETLKELDSSILSLSVLFRHARRFELHEACLDIFRCGSYRDDAYVRVLWSHIVEKEAKPPALLRKRMLALGQEFYPSDVAFPVSFIVQLLEKHAYVNSAMAVWKDAIGWVSKTMMEIGVPLGEIVDAYRMVIENPQQSYSGEESWSWSDEMAQLHIMKATECAVGLWTQQNSRDDDGQGVVVARHDFGRRSFLSEAEKVLRAISLCKSRLCSMSSAACVDLIQRFDSLEKMISPLTQ